MNTKTLLALAVAGTVLVPTTTAIADGTTYSDPIGDPSYYSYTYDDFTTVNDTDVDINMVGAEYDTDGVILVTQVEAYEQYGISAWVYELSTRTATPTEGVAGEGVYQAWVDDETMEVTLFDGDDSIVTCSEAFAERGTNSMGVAIPRSCFGAPAELWVRTATLWASSDSDDSITDFAPDLGQPFAGPLTATATASPATNQVPSLTVSPFVVKYGETANVTIQGTPGAVVDLYIRKYGGSFTKIRNGLVLDGNGRLVVPTRPDMNLRFQAFDRTVEQGSSIGGTDGLMTVEKYISINVNRVSAGRYTFSGSINPSHPGASVSLFRNGSLMRSGIPVNSSRVYSFTTNLAPGTYSFQVRTGTTGWNNASGSPVRSVRVDAPTTSSPTTSSPPAKPADRDCGDFSTQAEAQSFFDKYYPYYGDFSGLDADGNRIACESLP